MAKELAMVERNERGKQARQYFIEREKRARSAVTFVDKHVKADNLLGIRKVRQLLGVKEREFVARLIGARIVFRQGRRGELMPYAEYVTRRAGCSKLRPVPRADSTGHGPSSR